eukprot:tig00000042_g15393.t1
MSHLQEEMFKKKYGNLPNNKALLQKKLEAKDRKYFDSADWAQAKATGHTQDANVGKDHPFPTSHPGGSEGQPQEQPR